MACAQKLFKRLYTNENYVEFYIGVMAALKSYNRRIVKDITSWLLHIDEGKRYNLRVVSSLLKDKLVNILDYDLHISKRID